MMDELLYDFYDWLPSYGESSVVLYELKDSMSVVIEVSYEKEILNNQFVLYRRELLFSGVKYFIKSPLPGWDIVLETFGHKVYSSGCLTTVRNSVYLNNCKKFYASRFGIELNTLKHFYVQFLSENCSFHVLAKSVELSPEKIIQSLYE